MDDAVFSREKCAFAAHARARRSKAKKDAGAAPFATKYRPDRFAEVVGHEGIVERLQAFVRLGRVPNLLFDGPPGVGKTTCGRCLAREVLQDNDSRAFLWLNASDDRTATFVRTTLAAFVSKMITLPPGQKRIVFLDEVDSMAPDAQRLLKRMMESVTDAVTFILACNNLSRVAEGLQATCALFRFATIRASHVAAEVQRVAELEHIAIDGGGLRAIVTVADGDMRKGLNVLQQCAREGNGVGQSDRGTKCLPSHGTRDLTGCGTDALSERGTDEPTRIPALTGTMVYRLCEVPDASSVLAMLLLCLRGDVPGALRKARGLADEGHSPHDVLQTLHQVLRTPPAAQGVPGAPRVVAVPAVSGRRQYFDNNVGVRLRHAALAVVSTAISDARPRVAGPFYNASANGVPASTLAQLCACVSSLCELLSTEVQMHDSLFVHLRKQS